MPSRISDIFRLTTFLLFLSGSEAEDKSIQCYACGLPKISPEHDLQGSYGSGKGKKTYNHSCNELISTMRGEKIDDHFLRTCPVGVKSCFGASGFYDHGDGDRSNDILISFLGCVDSQHSHGYGCDNEDQSINGRDKYHITKQISVDVRLCFCSEHTCNHPNSDLLAVSDKAETFYSSLPLLFISTYFLTYL